MCQPNETVEFQWALIRSAFLVAARSAYVDSPRCPLTNLRDIATQSAFRRELQLGHRRYPLRMAQAAALDQNLPPSVTSSP